MTLKLSFAVYTSHLPSSSSDVDGAAVALFKLSCCLFMHLLHSPTVYCCPNTNPFTHTHSYIFPSLSPRPLEAPVTPRFRGLTFLCSTQVSVTFKCRLIVTATATATATDTVAVKITNAHVYADMWCVYSVVCEWVRVVGLK